MIYTKCFIKVKFFGAKKVGFQDDVDQKNILCLKSSSVLSQKLLHFMQKDNEVLSLSLFEKIWFKASLRGQPIMVLSMLLNHVKIDFFE